MRPAALLVVLLAALPAPAAARRVGGRGAAGLRRGGATATLGPVAALRASSRELRRTAPATHAAVGASLLSFVAARRPRVARLIAGHAVCCAAALRRGRAHVLLTHALVHATPSALLFGVLALILVAAPVEEAIGARKLGVLAAAALALGGLAAAGAQSLGARGGVVGGGAFTYGCGAVLVLRRPHQRVSLFFAPRTFAAANVGAALLAFDALLLACGHPGSAAHLGGALAGYVLHEAGYVSPRRLAAYRAAASAYEAPPWTPPPPAAYQRGFQG